MGQCASKISGGSYEGNFSLYFFALVCVISVAQTTDFALMIEQLMTPQELKESGVSRLTDTQRHALNVWLNRYSKSLLQLANRSAAEEPTQSTVRSKCSPAVESTLAGNFNGWSGYTIFKLDNGQIWEQAEYAYTYSYSY